MMAAGCLLAAGTAVLLFDLLKLYFALRDKGGGMPFDPHNILIGASRVGRACWFLGISWPVTVLISAVLRVRRGGRMPRTEVALFLLLLSLVVGVKLLIRLTWLRHVAFG
jgi:hypothetical protein